MAVTRIVFEQFAKRVACILLIYEILMLQDDPKNGRCTMLVGGNSSKTTDLCKYFPLLDLFPSIDEQWSPVTV